MRIVPLVALNLIASILFTGGILSNTGQSQSAGIPRAFGEPNVTAVDAHRVTALWDFQNLSGYISSNISANRQARLAYDENSYTEGPLKWSVATSVADQEVPNIAVDSKDEFIVVWAGYSSNTGFDMFGTKCDRNGRNISRDFEVSTEAGAQYYPAIAVDSKNNFIVTWQDARSGSNDTYAQRFDPNGTKIGKEIAVCTAINDQWLPAIAIGADNSFIITWDDSRKGSDWMNQTVYAQRFDANGQKLGDEFNVTNSPSIKFSPDIASDSNGNFVITWMDYAPGNHMDIYAQRFDTDGNRLGSPLQVSTQGSGTYAPSIAMDSKGNFIIAWYSGSQYIQLFDANGNKRGNNIEISKETIPYTYSYPDIAVDEKDTFIMTWMDNRSYPYNQIYAQHIAQNGSKLGKELFIYSGVSPKIAVGLTGAMIAWQEWNGKDSDISVRPIIHPYLPSGYLITNDLLVANLFAWKMISAEWLATYELINWVFLNYSTDGGDTWKSVPTNGSLAEASTLTNKIRIRANLYTGQNVSTPILYNISLSYLINKRPFVNSFPQNTLAPKNRPVTLSAIVADDDGDTLNFSWSISPKTGAYLTNNTTSEVNFNAERSGTYTVTMDVSDGYDMVTRTVSLSVLNHAPVINGSASLQLIKTVATALPFTASDEDNDTLNYHWRFAEPRTDAWFSDQYILQPKLTATNSTNFTIYLTVNDSEEQSAIEVNVTVVGRPPIANLTANRTELRAGEIVRFEVSSSKDPDGDVMKYYVDFGDGNSTDWFNSPITMHSYSREGFYLATLQVRDIDGNISLPVSVGINVVPIHDINNPPVLSIFKLPDAIAGKSYTFRFTATNVDNDKLTFVLLEGPAGLTMDSDGTMRWTPKEDIKGDFKIIISVSDKMSNVTGEYTLHVSQKSTSGPTLLGGFDWWVWTILIMIVVAVVFGTYLVKKKK